MKKIYHLSTCDTCKRILNELAPLDGMILQDIKTEEITAEQLKEMAAIAGSNEALFSKRARLYQARNLKEQELSEEDFASLILEHYTFLKRPVILIDGQIFIGNSKKVVAAAKAALQP